MMKAIRPTTVAEVLPYVVEDLETVYGKTILNIDPPPHDPHHFQFLVKRLLIGNVEKVRRNTGVILRFNPYRDASEGPLYSKLTLYPYAYDAPRKQVEIDGLISRAEIEDVGGSTPLHIASAAIFAYLQGNLGYEKIPD